MTRFRPAIVFLLMSLLHCAELENLFGDISDPDPCDPMTNLYLGNTHFFERDFVRPDGTIDYSLYMRKRLPSESPCDPLYDEDPEELRARFEQILREQDRRREAERIQAQATEPVQIP